MSRLARTALLGLGLLAALPLPCPPARGCSLCGTNIQQTATFRQDLAQARVIAYGAVTASRLAPGGTGTGTSEFQVRAYLKADPEFAGRKVLEVPRYIPVTDPKDPPQYVIFCDVFQKRLDVFRGVPVKSEAASAYVRGLMALEGKARTEVLRWCFAYLEHADREIANDAFLEFAKSGDAEVGQVAPTLAPDRLRTWLKEPQTPEHRLGLYAFLLGACGGEQDAALLRGLIEKPAERFQSAYDGLLGGYIQLRPKEGWELALSLLKDPARPFATRFAVVRMVRFFHGWRPRETREQVLQGMSLVLGQSDIADLAVEDLRRWQEWELTGEVVRLFGQKDYDAPLMRRALLRYALACPRPEAARLIAEVRRQDAELVRDVEESLQLEKPR